MMMVVSSALTMMKWGGMERTDKKESVRLCVTRQLPILVSKKAESIAPIQQCVASTVWGKGGTGKRAGLGEFPTLVDAGTTRKL